MIVDWQNHIHFNQGLYQSLQLERQIQSVPCLHWIHYLMFFWYRSNASPLKMPKQYLYNCEKWEACLLCYKSSQMCNLTSNFWMIYVFIHIFTMLASNQIISNNTNNIYNPNSNNISSYQNVPSNPYGPDNVCNLKLQHLRLLKKKLSHKI